MSITASMVKELREKTGVGMMDCKKALVQTEGNLDDAIKYLREKGLAAAAKKADREATEGRIVTNVAANKGVIVEINCETDFVAKNDQFTEFGQKVGAAVLSSDSTNVETLEVDGKALKDFTSEYVLKLGENLKVNKVEVIKSQGTITDYVHMNGKIGVLVNFSGNIEAELGKDIAMHIAAIVPQYLKKEDVPEEIINNEKEIIKKQALNEGKPEKIIENIVNGRVSKFYKETCLLEQAFVKDDKKAIKDILPKDITIDSFIRYSL